MKKLFFFSLALAALCTACLKDSCEMTTTYVEYLPVFADSSIFELSVEAGEVKELKNPGKIYYYGNYILINERFEGIHLIDNSDVTNPVRVAFYNISGNVDMAMKGNFLYADNYVYILVIDLSDINNPRVVNRIEKPQWEWIWDGEVDLYSLVVDYVPSDKTITVNCDDPRFGQQSIDTDDALFLSPAASESFDFNGATQTTSFDNGNANGQGGSFARFSLIDEHFYYVNHSSLKIFNVSDLSDPQYLNEVQLDWWGIETIFPYEDKLFVGSNDGMHILDNSDPSNPYHISTFEHARACDPVVVEGNTAYVTLRDGSECTGFINQLDVIDVSDIRNPTLIKSYEMQHPHGLAVRNDKLFLCEGAHGLKSFDVEEKDDIKPLQHIQELNTYDVISVNEALLLMVGDDGFYQWDVRDPEDMKVLSVIEVAR